jgi:hypothetical protein
MDAPHRTPFRIFVCYRRADSGGHAGRLYDHLKPVFGERNIFMDVGVLPGRDYVKALPAEVNRCDVVVAVIGPSWIKVKDKEGYRRLDDEEDWVRVEIETALVARKPVIPVLVGGAARPPADGLPGRLNRLARLQMLEIRDDRFSADAAELVDALRRYQRAKQARIASTQPGGQNVSPLPGTSRPATSQVRR